MPDLETLLPVHGNPALFADDTIVAWDITSTVRISFSGNSIFITGGPFGTPPTERTFTKAQATRFGLLLCAWAAGMPS